MNRAIWWAAGALLALSSCARVPATDRLLVGATVHSVRGAEKADVAIVGGRILALVRPDRDARWRKRAREVVDLAGAHVYAGFTESHGHLVAYGAALEQVDLRGVSSFAEVVERVRSAAAKVPKGEWIQGRGWDQNLWPDQAFPRQAALSAAVPDHPVALSRVDGHALLTNARGLALAGITRSTPDPPGGRILRDERGGPTGVLVDAAKELLTRVIPPDAPEAIERRALHASRELARVGFTEFHDAWTTGVALAVLQRLQREGRLPIRLSCMLDGDDDALLDRELPRGPWASDDRMLQVRAVKLFADGALGSRGAWLSAPYTDDPSTSGLQVTPRERLAAVVRRAGRAGFQPCIHAIGDAAVTEALDVFEEELVRAGISVRPRVEHAQIVRPEDVPRFAALGVIASVQTTHCTSDMPWAPQRLGAERILWSYRWRSLLDAGARLCLGSDVPVEDPDPRLGMWAGVTRRTLEGTPAEGWNAPEALTVQEVIEGYTSWAAYAGFEETWRGSIEPGYEADLTIFDRDLATGAPRSLVGARVLRTIVGGRDIYVAGGGS
jgi:predicted amidohydrolase YtcJ